MKTQKEYLEEQLNKLCDMRDILDKVIPAINNMITNIEMDEVKKIKQANTTK